MGDPIAAVSPVREVIRGLDPNISPSDTRPFTEMISFILLPAKFAAGLFGLFGVLALMLASAGLYGVMSSVVGRRTHEIGVRVALGAQHRDVLRLVLKQGLKLTAIGIVVGLVVAGAGTRVLSSLLYEISTIDPLTFIVVPLLLAIVAFLACYVPARRATKVDPMVALRYE
jgi:putative ABC transport system permease protein